jgi:hypothetical protein
MARSSSDIDTIIAELKTARDTRDAAIETAAAALDGSDDKNAGKLRSLNHAKTKASDKGVCVACNLKKDSAGNIIAMAHVSYNFADDVDARTGATISNTGLRSLLVDEAFSVPVATTVINL